MGGSRRRVLHRLAAESRYPADGRHAIVPPTVSAARFGGDAAKARARLARKLLDNPNARDLDDTVLVFFENLAYLTRKRVIDPDMVYNVFSIDVCNYWIAVKSYVEGLRKEANDGTLCEEMEELSKVMQAHKWRGPGGLMSSPGLRSGTFRFLEWESSRRL